MGFWDHLDELRGTIIKSVVVFVIAACLIGWFMREFYDVLLWPLEQTKEQYPNLVVDLGTQKIFEIFTMAIQICVIGGLVVSAPFILFFIAQFVSPALTEKEMKAVVPLCLSALVLFLFGAAFGFFLLMPKAIETAVDMNEFFKVSIRWTIGDYFSVLSWLVLGVGATFEFPLLIILLVWLGVLSTAFLKKYRRHAIVLIFIIAAVVTPTPDPFVQTIFAAPLYFLYEISIIVSRRIEKRREREMLS